MPLDGTQYVQSSAGRRRITRVRRKLSFDYETFSEAQLTGGNSVGAWEYSLHPSTEALMVAYRLDHGELKHVDLTREAFPVELREALLDPECEKWGFNSAFERLITLNTLRIDTPYEGWRCTMALAAMQSFSGSLLDIGVAMGLPGSTLKDKEGDRLIRLFAMPQRITQKNPWSRRTRRTDPEEWQRFCEYNAQDVVAEESIQSRLIRFEVPDEEWTIYEIDQRINDRGLPVNREFVQQAEELSVTCRLKLHNRMKRITGLRNPNSRPEILPWVQERGYPYDDLQKATVTKALSAHDREPFMLEEAAKALRTRLHANRTSVKKYPAILRRLSIDNNLRHSFQYGGAARTLRWSGRGPQPHNLVRTPKQLEAEDGDWSRLEGCAEVIESGIYENLELLFQEPMTALAGSVRSSFQAHPGRVLRVCDLKAIESAVLAWLSGCGRMLSVFRDGRDPYRDFGVELFKKAYAEITSGERTICKPAVLGCGYQLGGGAFKNGKRTGLWGYAENMGVDITEEEADAHVKLFRSIYSEIPLLWRALDDAAKAAMAGRPSTVNGLLRFEMDHNYLTLRLPSGRKMYYFRPKLITKTFEGKKIDPRTGKPETFTRRVVSYMGRNQVTNQWGRTATSGGKWTENATQAVARDILALGMRRAHDDGFNLVGSVHDELIAHERKGDNYYTAERLRDHMIAPIPWARGLPLDASAYEATIYRKD